MRAAPAEHIDIESIRLGEQQIGLSGDEGESFEEADADASVLDDAGDGEGGGFYVVAAADDFEVWADGAEVFVGVFVGQVAEAEGLGDFPRGQEFLELYESQTQLWSEVPS
jgi:hypothetical protein